MDSEERRIVMNLLKEGDNERTVRKIIENLPLLDLGDQQFEDRYKSIVSNLTREEELNFWKHPPKRGKVRELNIDVQKWTKEGLPFNLMLHTLDDSNSLYTNLAVRVLVSNENYEINLSSLEKFSNSSEGIVGEFPKLAGWPYWRSVRASEGNQKTVEDTVIEAAFFEDEFWTQVEKRLKSQLDPLLKHIDKWIEARQKQTETN